MSLSHLHDHEVQFWKPTESRDDQKRVVKSYAKVGAVVTAAVQVARRALQPGPGGEAEAGLWKIYADVDAEGAEGRICQVLTGPEAPRTLRITNAYRPRGRFLQAEAVNFKGELT